MRTLTTSAVTTLLLVALALDGSAQNRLSPHETVSATVDGADLSITYGRPSMRGRTIVGALVPYGRVWCPGADEATTLVTSRPLRIDSLSLEAGGHTLWMLPEADSWTLIVNEQTGQFHTRYDARYDLGRIPLRKRTLAGPVEQLTFAIERNPGAAGGVINAGGVIKMTWETTEVSAPFTVVQ